MYIFKRIWWTRVCIWFLVFYIGCRKSQFWCCWYVCVGVIGRCQVGSSGCLWVHICHCRKSLLYHVFLFLNGACYQWRSQKIFQGRGRNVPGVQELQNSNFFIQKKLFTLSITKKNAYFFNVGMEPGGDRPPPCPPVAMPLASAKYNIWKKKWSNSKLYLISSCYSLWQI